MSQALMAALHAALPTAADLEALPASAQKLCKSMPIVDGRLALPFAFEYRDGKIDTVVFESYDLDSPLGSYGVKLYRIFVKHPEAASTRCLVLGNVACKEFYDTQLLGDPIHLLVNEGLPPNLESLEFSRIGPVTNSGDLGYYATGKLRSLLPKLGGLREIAMASCEGLGRLDLPNLRSLRIHADVSAKNLVDLARARLPALERLELGCDLYSLPERRSKGMRALLRSSRLPKLVDLTINELDLDEDRWCELDDEDLPEEPDLWVDMIADAPLLRQLQSLSLSFQDPDREVPRLIDRADAFGHLATLDIWGVKGQTRLERPTRDTLREALEG